MSLTFRSVAGTISCFFLASLLAGCTRPLPPPAATPPPASGKPPVRVGVVTSQSGPLAGYGLQELRGLKLGLEYATNGTLVVAGRSIDVIVRDDEGKPEVGASQATDLIEQAVVDIIQGSAASAVAAQIIPIVRQRRKPFIIAPAADDALTGRLFNKYIFRVSPNASQEILAGATHAGRLGKSIAIIAPDSAWGKSSVAAWETVMQKVTPAPRLLEPVYAPLDTGDFTPYLKKVVGQHPEVCVVLWSGDGVVKLFQQVAQQGLSRIMKITAPFGDSAALQVMQGVNGIVGAVDYYHAFPTSAANDWLVSHHQQKFGLPPDLFTAGGFDAGIVIVAALARTGGDTDAERLVTALEGLSVEGVRGRLTFRKEDHQALLPTYIAQLRSVPGVPQLTLVREVPAGEITPPLQVSG